MEKYEVYKILLLVSFVETWYKRLLVAVDGSEHSYKALDHAVAIAEKFDSELVLLTVIPTMIVPFFPDKSFDPIIHEEVYKYQDRMMNLYHNMLKDAEETISSKHPNLNIQTILREGRPSTTIVDVAEKEGCDMIVMGSRGMGGITGWVLGSTSHRVAASCKKPVMIIK